MAIEGHASEPGGDYERDAELRATSDELLRMLERIRTLERQKRAFETDTPEFVALAEEIEDLSRIVFRWSQFQRDVAESAPGERERGTMSGRPIDEIASGRLDRILAAWREAEFRLERAKPGSAEAAAATDTIERLREEYRRVQDRKLGAEGARPGGAE